MNIVSAEKYKFLYFRLQYLRRRQLRLGFVNNASLPRSLIYLSRTVLVTQGFTADVVVD